MYRKRARAAHVLQPAAGGVATSTAPPGVATQEQAAGQLYGNSQAEYSNTQASAATQQPVQFFNPMTYQNGYSGGDQQYAGDLQQHPGDGSGQQGFNHSTQQYPQPSLNPQDGYDYQGNWQSQQPSAEQQPPQLHQQQSVDSSSGGAQQNWQHQDVNVSEHQVTENVAQNAGGYADESQQREVNSEEPQQQQNLELILDPSGQWCWDYYAQQWVPYYANQQQQQALGSHQQNSENSDKQIESTTETVNGERNENSQADSEVQKDHESIQNQDLVNGLENLEIGQEASDLSPPDAESAGQNFEVKQYPEDQFNPVNYPAVMNQDLQQSSQEQFDSYNVQPQEGLQYESDAVSQLARQSVESQNLNNDDAPVVDWEESGGQAMVGPPDLVDLRQYNQPEIVNDVNNHITTAADKVAPPPDMFASLPGSSYPYPNSSGAVGDVTGQNEEDSQHHNDESLSNSAVQSNQIANVDIPPMDHQIPSAAPDLTAQSFVHQSAATSNVQLDNHAPGPATPGPPIFNPMLGGGGAFGGALAHDQHHDFYKDQIESAMPDLTSGQRSSWDANSNRISNPPRRPSQDKAPDILRTEPLLVPSTDRNLYMETGELQEEDANRVSQEISSSMASSLLQPVLSPGGHSLQQMNKPPSDLPPMVGGNEPPRVGAGTDEPPSIERMVVGESGAAPPPSIPPPTMMPIPPTNQRLVEGGSTSVSGIVPPLPAREIEGEVDSTEQRPNLYPNTIDRTIEGEDVSSHVPVAPPPVQTREVEGEPQPLPPPPLSSSRLPPPPPSNSRMPSGRNYVQLPSQPDLDYGSVSSVTSTPLDSSPIHQVASGGGSMLQMTSATPSPNTEVRSAAAGSDKRDETVMGGPPPPVKAPPLPTPGRAVAGQEATQQGYAPPPPQARRRGDDYKKSTYDSDDENVPESESERNSVTKRRIQPRRNLSPKGNRPAPRPVRGYDRLNRSSTDRDEDSDRKHEVYRDDDDDFYNGNKSMRNYDRRPNRRDYDRRHVYDDRDDDRGSVRGAGREDDRRSHHGREDDRRSIHGRDREDDRRSYHGGGGARRRDQGGRYRDRDGYYGRSRIDSELDRESYYGDDHLNRSRPGSRAGSVSHFDPNESMFSRVGGSGGMAGGMAFFPQLLQQQYQYQIQYQIQTAVQEMEKSLTNPAHVKTYKAYWDTYGKQPQLMEKLRLENPVLHHLLQHFQRNFLHLIEEKKPAVAAGNKELNETTGGVVRDTEDKEVEEFSRKFHQLSPTHRPESRQAGQESTIAGPQDTSMEHTTSSSSILPARLTPLMFSRPHVCARLSASGLLVKVEAHSPREGQSATVELHSVASLLQHTQEYRELAIFPGPLKPKETHRNDVIKFCERKIHDARERRMVDRDSYELIWRMLILLLRQKGQVEGSDLAGLLITEKSRMNNSMEALPLDRSRGNSSYRGQSQLDAEETGSMSSFSEDHGEKVVDRTMSSKTYINSGASQEEYVAKFRSYLLHGNKQEGLEFAMSVGLWGHALFLASKMDQRTYASVMTRFANGLAVNDPLQTLYQLMSARIPAAMKNFADQRLGDWRPHLAMILSNPYPGSDINRRSMKTLGDTLLSKGQIYAAQFCYIVSGLEFGTFSKKTSKLVLLLSMPGEKSVQEFATNEAIQCTEIYEFVQKLGSPEFEMPTLQPFKLLHAIRLLECGLTNQAQAYCREIAEYVINNPTSIVTDFLPDFLQQLETLSDRLKYQDPLYTTSSGELSEIPDPEWMTRLRETVHNITYNDLYTQQQAESTNTYSYNEPGSGYYDSGHYQNQEEQPQTDSQGINHQQEQHSNETGVDGGHAQLNNNEHKEGLASHQEQPVEHQDYNSAGEYQNSNGWGGSGGMASIPENQEAVYGEDGSSLQSPDEYQQQPAPPTMFNPGAYSSGGGYQDIVDPGQQNQANPSVTNSVMPPMFNPADAPTAGYHGFNNPGMSSYPNMPSQISDDPTAGSRKTSISESEPRKNSLPSNDIMQDKNANNDMPSNKSSPTKANGKASKSEPVKKSSWLPGFIGKILRAPNQVHLPDDTHKTIYYDDKLGRWVNTDEDENSSAPAAPPPMDPAFMRKSQEPKPSAPSGVAPALSGDPGGALPPGPTNFRVAKRRGRAAYVDVNRQSGLTKPVSATAMPPMMMADDMQSQQPSSLPPMLFNPGAVEATANGSGSPDEGPGSLQLDSPGDVGSGAETSSVPAGVPMMFNPSSMGSVTAPPTF